MSFRTFEVSDATLLGGGIHHVTVKSAALRRRADVSFYVPEGAKAESLPLVILLHGIYGSHWAWLYKGGAHQVLDRLIAEENLPPMMLAMPSDGLWGDGSGYAQHRSADYAAWIVEEVPEAAAEVDSRCRTSPRFISGLSMGGYGALRLGLLNPKRFTAISAHSSITHVAQMQGYVEESLVEFDLTDTNPLAVIDCAKLNARLPHLRFDCGSDDELVEPNRTLHRELTEAGIPHVYEEFSGGHTWDYWHEHLADSLRFFKASLVV
ncbi:MAG: esterase family protein [Prosthecobacter sp.]|jgi:putative tributyrin esterase|uniref:alpha/beta hydrolase n=1 Tax=Prosthecobacter sp. TaxID=1965333 RepID=UPI0019DD3856|nr:alpha/beta hydrolase-fold protein [Prosthecobacter sp.]MBE2286172.1 esterase family protein [Prosthecobacter sp.]